MEAAENREFCNLPKYSFIFMLPEILDIICGLLDKKDYAKLLYLCRGVYKLALPIVWWDADLGPTLCLIPGTELPIISSNTDPDTQLSNSSSPLDLTRFEIHSPLIRTLRSRYPKVTIDQDKLWNLGTPIIPNLQRLIINDLRLGERWWYQFLTPCLREILMVTADEDSENALGSRYEACPVLMDETILDIISRISRSCPHLEKLRLFPVRYIALDVPHCRPLSYLKSVSLVIVSLGSKIFCLLGQLPRLEALTLRSANFKIVRCSPVTVPEESFLSLRHLALYGLPHVIIQQLCKTSPLFRCLVSFKVISGENESVDHHAVAQRSLDIFASLGRNSPDLADLYVQMGASKAHFVCSHSHIEKLAHMPLTRLRLGNVTFEEESDEEIPETDWTALLSVLPQLEEFHLEYQFLSSYELGQFATLLPELRLLVLGRIIWGQFRRKSYRSKPRAQQQITIRCSFFGLGTEFDGTHEVVHTSPFPEAAKFLCELWPNLVCEAGTALEGGWALEEVPVALNNHFKMMRFNWRT